MTIEEVSLLLEYNKWANARIFAAAQKLTEEQQEASAVSSFSSIRDTLAHVVGSERYWLEQWTNHAFADSSVPTGKPKIEYLRAGLAVVESDRARFLASLQVADLDKAVTYSDEGGEFSIAFGQSVRHMVNHSTYHRGQIAAQFRQPGLIPSNTDFARGLSFPSRRQSQL